MEPFQWTESGERPGLFFLESWMERYPGLTVGFSSRLGGVSKDEFAALNCGLHVADRAEDVVANRGRVAEAAGIPLSSWTYGDQVHGSAVAVVTSKDQGRGTLSRESEFKATDAFITSESGLCLGALFADCVPLYFYDPVRGLLGLAHAGWKGTVAQIGRNTVQAMQNAFGSEPHDIIAAVGPSIGACCYEVDDFLIGKVNALLTELGLSNGGAPETAFYSETENPGKFNLDLQLLNRQIMIKAGILPSSIEISQLCTSCHTDRLYSHRKENGKTGRMVAWIGHKPSNNTLEW